jgi:hypothetical protein
VTEDVEGGRLPPPVPGVPAPLSLFAYSDGKVILSTELEHCDSGVAAPLHGAHWHVRFPSIICTIVIIIIIIIIR